MHLYLHVPYCTAKCPYCDFNSVAGREDEFAAYVEALISEVRRLPRGPYATVFLGGGTPTRLGAALLARLLAGVREHIQLETGYEWTCEANPGSSDTAVFDVMAEHGINRISLGIQSTHDHHLRFLGRVHDAAQAEVAIAAALRAVPRVSCDLIMGLPDQTLTELAADLDLYRRFGLDHASVYHLAYESGTEFYARRAKGELHDISAEASQVYFNRLYDTLAELGLHAYETSNFAKSGAESRHNLAYWRQADYHAAGAGAVSTIHGRRLTREPHSGKYITAINAGTDAAWKVETLSPAEQLAECWMLGLRLVTGVRADALAARGDDPARWTPIAASLADLDLVEHGPWGVRLTRRGRIVQDEVTMRLMP